MRLSLRQIVIIIVSSLAFLLYYSVTSFHARLSLIEATKLELKDIQAKHKKLLEWKKKTDLKQRKEIQRGYQSENLQSVQEELIHLKKDYNELAAQQEAYIAIQLNKAAQDDADLTQKVTSWDDLATTKALLKQDGLDYDSLVLKGVMGGQENAVLEKRDYVKKMMKHAWSGYVKYAWGWNQLKPVTKQHDDGVFGPNPLGATLVDAMDTLFLMEEYGEVVRCKKWLAKNFKTNFMKAKVLSVFETTIRFIGGFNTMFAFTGQELFKELSVFVADKLVPAFTSSNTGINLGYINLGLEKQVRKVYEFIYVSETGSLQLEWGYLSYITGDMTYHQYTKGVYEELFSRQTQMNGLWPNKLYVHDKTSMEGLHTLGSMGDSFYEYLLKFWVFTGKEDEIVGDRWSTTLKGIMKWLVHTSKKGHMFLAAVENQEDVLIGQYNTGMDHLACFSGGLFGLSSIHSNYKAKEALELGINLTTTCQLTYAFTDTKIGPDRFYFSKTQGELMGLSNSDKRSQMRPEVAESIFVMWRVTKDERWRTYGWEMVQAMDKHYRTPYGYSGIYDVYNVMSKKDDVMQSFFLAETLKYLYLLFSDDSLLPLDQYVFNTEAHPMPILKPGSLPKLETKEWTTKEIEITDNISTL